MARIFVTGGSGFLGGALITTLCARGDRVVALARSEAAERAVQQRGASAVVRGDVSDPELGEPVVFKHWVNEMLATQGVTASDRSLPFRAAYALGWAAELVWPLLLRKAEPPISRPVVALIGQEVSVNDAKARRELGYKAHVSMRDGMAGLAC